MHVKYMVKQFSTNIISILLCRQAHIGCRSQPTRIGGRGRGTCICTVCGSVDCSEHIRWASESSRHARTGHRRQHHHFHWPLLLDCSMSWLHSRMSPLEISHWWIGTLIFLYSSNYILKANKTRTLILIFINHGLNF